MPKKVKFPLEMKNGVKVRSLEEMRCNFDAEDLVRHYISGKLQTWLGDRCYYSELEKINNIRSKENLVNILCDILGIDSLQISTVIDYDEIAEKTNKIQKLKMYTDNPNVIGNVNNVAFCQEEFDKLISNGLSEIYLVNNQYHLILKNVCNIRIVGIGNVVLSVKEFENIDINKSGIAFDNIQFEGDFNDIIANKKRNLEYCKSSFFFDKITGKDEDSIIQIYDKIKKNIIDLECPVEDINNDDECRQLLGRVISVYKASANLRFYAKNPVETLFPREHENNLVDWFVWRSFCQDYRIPNDNDPDWLQYFGPGRGGRYSLVNCASIDRKGADEFIEGCTHHVAKYKSINPRNHFLLYVLMIVAVDGIEFNNKLNEIAEYVYFLQFDDGVLDDFLTVVREIVAGDISNIRSKCKTNYAREFFDP